jgi:hypothetical protein
MASQMVKWSARIAIGFGAFLAIAEVVRNWGDWGYWPFWVVDYIAAGLLIWGGLGVVRARSGCGVRLAGAWGFACAMFYTSFFSHLASLGRPDRGPVDPVRLTVIIGVMFAITVAGFAMALWGPRPEGVEK